MNTIPSPYNFVPLSKHVFFPDWSGQVSMDVPFSDGISGTLEIKVTARSPVYIRNGGDHPDDAEQRRNDPDYSDFFRAAPGGPYAIPGTSIKGMLRSVIEIITFSKIAGTKGQASRVSDHRYAIRDLHNDQYKQAITESINNAYRPRAKAGWLRISNEGKWQVTLCDYARVEQKDIAAAFNVSLSFFSGNISANDKYNYINKKTPYNKVVFSCGEEIEHLHNERKIKLLYKKAADIKSGDTPATGEKIGVLVFTGQPSPRKHMEFIFFNETEKVFPVSKELKTDFEFIHSVLGENRKPNIEWEFWKHNIDNEQGIPVFFMLEGQVIKSIGLALMYRFPYKNTILETVAHTSADHLNCTRLDFGETLFGRVEESDALRGRITAETLIAQGDPTPLERVDTILGAPKPTYYPNYIRQKADGEGAVAGGKYVTYMDDRAEIRGWKRYLARKDGEQSPLKPGDDQKQVSTSFRPLPAGTVFTGTIHLHNLKPAELGALIWAITWGGEGGLRHSLGMAKPYGYGSVSLSVTDRNVRWCNPQKEGGPDLDECKKAFVETMNAWYGSTGESQPWEKCDALAALKAMANPQSAWNHRLRYPALKNESDENEFVEFKKQFALLLPPEPLKAHKKRTETKKINKPQDKSNTDKFLTELDKVLPVNKISKRLKAFGLTPETTSPEDKKRIMQKLMQIHKKNNDFLLKQIIDQWK